MDIKSMKILNDGNKIPILGLGLYKAKEDECIQAICKAAQIGYRHFDTASFYGNHTAVGQGIRACGIAREELFVVSKLWPGDFDDPKRAIEKALNEINIGYLDAYLLHWPAKSEANRYRAWETVLSYQQKGLIKSVGVSNFSIHHLEDLIFHFDVVPAVNQAEMHPWYPQRELRQYMEVKGIAFTAWGPLFHGHLGEIPELEAIAAKYKKSAAQIVLKWHLQSGNVVIPKSTNPMRIKENSELYDFVINDEDMNSINHLECGKHFGKEPIIE